MGVLAAMVGSRYSRPAASPIAAAGAPNIPPWAQELIKQNTPNSSMPGAPAPGEIPPWVDMAALRNAAGDSPYEVPDQKVASNPFEFIWNTATSVPGDVGQLATGLASLVGLGAGDVYNLAGAAKDTLMGKDNDRDYFADDFLKSMVFDPDKAKEEGSIWSGVAPGLVDVYKEQYGGLSNISKTVQNDPLFVAGDLMAVGSLAGKGVEAAARAALPSHMDELARVGEMENALLKMRASAAPTDEVTKYASQVEDALKNLSPGAAQVKKTLPGAGQGKLTLTPEEAAVLRLPQELDVPLGGFKANLSRAGGKELPYMTQQHANPFRRWVRDKAMTPFTNPVNKLERTLGDVTDEFNPVANAAGALAEGDPRLAQRWSAEADQMKRVLDAAGRYGIARVEKPYISELKAKRVFDAISGNFVTSYYGERDQVTKKVTRRITAEMENIVRQKNPGLRGRQFNDEVERLSNVAERWMQVDTPGSHGKQDVGAWRAHAGQKFSPEDSQQLSDIFGRDFDHQLMAVRIRGRGDVAPTLARIQQAVARRGGRVHMDPDSGLAGQAGPDGLTYDWVTVDLPTGSYTVKLLNEAGLETARAIDTLLPHLDNLEQMVITGRQRLAHEAHNANLKGAVEKIEAEVKAIYREIEDISEHAVIGTMRMFDQTVDAKAALIAGLRADRQVDVIAPAMKKQKFWDHDIELADSGIPNFRELRERQYLPIKLELFLSKGVALRSVLENISKASKAKDDAALAKHTEQLRLMGYSTPKEALTELVSTKADSRFILDQARGGGNDATQAFMNSVADLPMWEKLDADFQAVGRQSPIYYPWMDPETMGPGDWTFKRTAINFNKAKEASGKNFKRALGWLYLNGTYERNPIQAYARAGAQVRKYLDMEDFADEITRRHAREITTRDELAQNEALWVPDLTKFYLKSRAEIELNVMRQLIEGKGEADAWVAGLRQAFDGMDEKMAATFDLDSFADELAAVFGGEDQVAMKLQQLRTSSNADPAEIHKIRTAAALAKGNKPPPKIYAIPKVVANRMDQMGKFQLGWKARVFWDGPMNVWKGAVLAFSPRWIFYNLLGNITFLKMQGGSLLDVGRIMAGKVAEAKILKGAADEIYTTKFLNKHDQIMNRLATDNPALHKNLTGGFFSDVDVGIRHLGQAENTLPGEYMKQAYQAKPVKAAMRGAARMRKLNELIEESFREASYLTALEKQAVKAGVQGVGRSFFRSHDTLDNLLKHGMDDLNAARALDEVNYFFNDYRRMGPMERNLLKRFIAPFWSFYKHIAKLIVTYPFEHPLRATVMRYMGELSREMAAEFGAMPDWLVGAVPIGEGAAEGETRFLNTRGANPFNAMSNPLESLGTSMAPQFKMLMEQITGRSMLTGKPFSSPNAIVPFGSSQQYAIDPVTGDVDPTQVRPDLPYHLATQFPQFKLAQDIFSMLSGEGVGARYGTGEMMIDEATGQPLYPDNFAVTAASLGGLSQTDFALQEFQARQAEEERNSLVTWLRRQGFLEPAEETA